MSAKPALPTRHEPVHAVPLSLGRPPHVFLCSQAGSGCLFEVAITTDVPFHAAETQFITDHTDKQVQ